MPCVDYQSNDYDYQADFNRMKKRADKLARIACKAMDELVKQGKADFLLLKDKEVRDWYEQHVEDDRKAREAREEKQRKLEAERLERERRERIRDEALSKLTAEEREILLGKK